MSRLVLVAVPDAEVRVPPRLGVVVVPQQLTSLGEAGMADWPATIGAASLVVEVQAPDGTISTLRHVVVEAGLSDVWNAAMAGAVVGPVKSQVVYAPPTVRDTSGDASHVVGSFATSAQVLSTPGPDSAAAVESEVSSWDEGEPVPPPTPVEGRLVHGDQAPLDVHGAVAFLREHPTVLRALGLVLRLDLPIGAEVPDAERLPRSTRDEPHLIRVVWPSSAVAADIVSPWTAYEFDGERFAPQSAGDLRDGLVDIGGAGHSQPLETRTDGKWEVATFDVDGGSARLRDAARAIAGERTRIAGQQQAQDDPRGFTVDALAPSVGVVVTPPTLRSAGLALLRRGRGEQLRDRVRVAAENATRGDAAAGPPLTAEDLVLGYRLDIKAQGADAWLSLCRREGGYTVAGIEVAPDGGVEEGHIKARAAMIDDTRERKDGVPELLSDEVVCRWSGWSVAVPRPVMDRSTSRGRGRRRSRSLPFEFDWSFTPPTGSLPNLRFGRDYRMRVRVADIAGGGIGPDSTDNDGVSDLVGYGRFEPVLPPFVVPPEGLVDAEGNVDVALVGPGGAVDRLVVRSDPNALALADGVTVPVYPANDQRVLRAPTTTFEIAEQHGSLDGASEATWALAARAMNLTSDGVPAVESDETVAALADPAAAGVAAYLHDVDTPEGVGALDDDAWSEWPTDETKSVRLVAGALGTRAKLDWGADGTLTVTLPPAGEATLELSSYVRRDDLSDFAIKTWLPSAGEDLAVAGRHAMVTPARTMRLVHAVRRPLRMAQGLDRWLRGPGDTHVRLALVEGKPMLDLDPASTAQLDVLAAWDDVVDDPSEAAAVERPGAALVRSIVVGRTAVRLPELGHELGDTKHRRVTYTASATGRFRELFDEGEDARRFVAQSVLKVLEVPSSARPDPPVVIGVLPSFAWSGLEVPAGWSSQVGAVLQRRRGGGRLRIELARPWFSSGRDERLAVLVRGDTAADGPPGSVRRYLSEVGRDPIYDALGDGGDAFAAERWVAPQFVKEDADVAAFRPLAELGPGQPGVIVKPYAVRYEDGRCFADVVVTGLPDRSYCPLVRLAVARHQDHSLDGLALSTVVRLDPAPLMPDRVLTVERVAEGVRVTLGGRGPLSLVGRTNRVDVMVERLNAAGGVDPSTVGLTDLGGLAGAGGVAAWARVPGAAVSGGLDVALPVLAIPAGDGPMRLYVREVERFFTGDAGVVIEPAPGGELSERVVFADTIALV